MVLRILFLFLLVFFFVFSKRRKKSRKRYVKNSFCRLARLRACFTGITMVCGSENLRLMMLMTVVANDDGGGAG